ncbi:MAG TPA: response regulator [Spirochaetota bacterium]|nr:response regulator [Spirochaetota bacterium]HQJ71719.1 response regulator [Spirochaetota bacterium]HRS77015.1 response regulator [Spirochaetota bacterium]HRT75838.1 response regulator [Spirochaetota bacterium]
MEKQTILIVEDEAITALDVQNNLKSFGFEVIGIVSNGEAAIEKAESSRPDIILMDIVLSGKIDGIAASMAIKERFNIPVIYMTGNADIMTVNRARETAPYGYIVKPINRQNLYSTIDTALHRYNLETELKKKQEELEAANITMAESKERYEKLFENAGDAILIMKSDTFIECNRSTLEIFGCDRGQIIGHSPADFSPATQPDGSDSVEKALGYIRASMEGWPQHFEWLHRRPDGSTFYADVSLTAMELRGGTHIQAIVRDISERKRAAEEKERIQAQLIQAQKMEAIGTLAGGIAHDFNNMLGGILGSLNLLELLAEKENLAQKEAFRKYLDTASESTRRAAEVTRQLLTLSRRQNLQFAPVDIMQSIRNVLKICKNSFPKSVNLDFPSQDSPLMVNADFTQIEQVILNLCVNASHAMTIMRNERGDEGGTLSVQAARVKCDENTCAVHPQARADADYARIKVSDTGIGMDEETRKRIFEPFFTTKAQGSGTGLGLAMVYNIVTQHQGFIDVYSEPGSGSTFTVYIPALAEAAAGAGRGTIPEAIERGTGRILVIDDEAAILRIARGMLEQCGYEVITATNGKDGVMAYDEEADGISAVILDLSMPGISGNEVLRQLREINPSVKVLIASGLAEDEEIRRITSGGSVGFIQKPYTAVELSSMLKKLLAP